MVRCRDLGFEEPDQQVALAGIDGRVYRCDFAWRDGQVLGEADGRIKYLDDGERPGADALWAEKRREDALRFGRRAFVRISWEDAWHGDALATKLDRAGVPRIRRTRHPLTF